MGSVTPLFKGEKAAKHTAAMVCISCILIPLALYIWHRFLQPVFLKMWNPFSKVEDQTGKSPTTTTSGDSKMSCPFSSGSSTSTATQNGTAATGDAKKDD